MPSVSLQLITAEITPDLKARLESFAPYFDKIYVQVNGSDTAPRMVGNIEVSYFKWCDDFAAARNALWGEVKTDYTVWADSDDEIMGLENLSEVIDHMEAEGIGIMFAPYHYLVTNHGTQELQNRERIIKTSISGEWKGRVHETFIPSEAIIQETTNKLQWFHRKTKQDHHSSTKRNRRLLELEYNRSPRDPRIAYYLGLNYGMDGLYEQAIECFLELIRTGGWDEERYRAWLQIFSCYFELGRYDQAIDAALKATTELPEWPDAYFMLQQVYYQMDDHQKSIQWYEVGKSKPQPESDSAFNPTVRLYQPLRLAGESYLYLGSPKKALNTLLDLQHKNPSYPIPQLLKDEVIRAMNIENAIDSAKHLIDYVDNKADVFKALPKEIQTDVRMVSLRRSLLPGKKWPEGSVVFYCGGSYEPWGPDTLDKGMGGSEEAVVYLSRELRKLGKQMVVYNQRESWAADETHREGDVRYAVEYKPWTDTNPNDEFDTFVAWRSPSELQHIKARRKLCDLHDIIPQEQVYAAIPYCDKFLFKSQFHRDLYPEVPEEKVAIIGNGIMRSQFK